MQKQMKVKAIHGLDSRNVNENETDREYRGSHNELMITSSFGIPNGKMLFIGILTLA